MILGGGAVCLLLSAHRAVIFAIAQLSCFSVCRAVDRGSARLQRYRRIDADSGFGGRTTRPGDANRSLRPRNVQLLLRGVVADATVRLHRLPVYHFALQRRPYHSRRYGGNWATTVNDDDDDDDDNNNNNYYYYSYTVPFRPLTNSAVFTRQRVRFIPAEVVDISSESSQLYRSALHVDDHPHDACCRKLAGTIVQSSPDLLDDRRCFLGHRL